MGVIWAKGDRVSGNKNTVVDDLGPAIKIVGFAIALSTLAGIIYSVFAWTSDLHSRSDASAQHESMRVNMMVEHSKFETKEHAKERDQVILKALDHQTKAIDKLGDDMTAVRRQMWEIRQGQ